MVLARYQRTRSVRVGLGSLVGAAIDELKADEIEGDALDTADGVLEAGEINSATVGMAVRELKAGDIESRGMASQQSESVMAE